MATGDLAKLQLAVEETERLGERFLEVRAEMVATDKARQETRQAMTALRKQPADKAVLVTRPLGVMLQVPQEAASELLQSDMRQHESRLEELRRDEKRLMGLLADKGAGPQRVGPGVLQAMLTLQDTGT